MTSARLLNRNVRPQQAQLEYDDDTGEDVIGESSSLNEQESDGMPARSDEEVNGEEHEVSDDFELSDSDEDGATRYTDSGLVGDQITNVSFGILKQAQDALSRKRKRGSDQTQDQDQKLEALRQRLRQIKESKSLPSSSAKDLGGASAKLETRSRRIEGKDGVEEDTGSDSDSAPSEEGDDISRSRTSKHAPAAQSSKHQVSRRRNVIDVPQRRYRDPRFDAIQQQRSAHTGDSEKAYGFLREYQKAEIEELQAAAKKSRNEEDAARLRRTAGSMRNQIMAREAKERTQAVIRQHRKEERLKVEQGKTPYYLKDKEIKERALVEKYKGLKSKERERLMERRQRKEGQKEKKRMPNARRMVG